MITTCRTIWRRVAGPIGGAWIPYTAAQVTARRLAQMVAVVICTTVPGPTQPPCPHCPPPEWAAPQPIAFDPWRVTPLAWPGADLPPTPIPEPGTAALLLVGIVALLVRRWR